MIFILFTLFLTILASRKYDAVLLQNVQVLTLSKNEWTTGRRFLPIPQLNCVGGDAQHMANKVQVVQCTNMGFDGIDVNWKCEANINTDITLGKAEVYCEGYDNPDDPYILKGSCGLEYELLFTDSYYYKKNQPSIVTTTTTYMDEPIIYTTAYVDEPVIYTTTYADHFLSNLWLIFILSSIFLDILFHICVTG